MHRPSLVSIILSHHPSHHRIVDLIKRPVIDLSMPFHHYFLFQDAERCLSLNLIRFIPSDESRGDEFSGDRDLGGRSLS